MGKWNTVQYTLNSILRDHPIASRDVVGTVGRIARWQMKSRMFPGSHRERWVNDAVLVAHRGMSGATGNLYYGLHEPKSMALIAHLLRPGDLFIDAGANVGSYTVLAGKVAGATVHAFEPSPTTAAALRANVAANGIDAVVHEVALGDHDGEARFTDDRDCMNGLSETGALVVPLRRLDGFGLEPVAIKADLEGGELGMLQGALETIKNPKLIAFEIEAESDDIKAILQGAGFVERWYDLFSRTLSKTPLKGPGNALFIRNEDEVAARLRNGPAIEWGGRKF